MCIRDSFLLDTWDNIMNALEDGDTVASLTSIDFEKAFNRMDHKKCLEALKSMGASQKSTDYVAAFLYGRTMSVKVGKARSTPRPVPGGSPQGSILGFFLFSVTTNAFAELPSPFIEIRESVSTGSEASGNSIIVEDQVIPPVMVCSTPSSRGQFAHFQPPASLANLSGEYQSDEEEFRFFRARDLSFLDSTLEPSLEVAQVPNCTCPEPISSYVYIDDFNMVEKLKIGNSQSHITTRKRELRVLALKSEAQFANVQDLADQLNMKVNNKKTQVLCIHANKVNKVSSYIRTNTGDINPKDLRIQLQ